MATIFTFYEADLISFLINYEYLVVQESLAMIQGCAHEPALPLARRYLDSGEPLLRTLPNGRQLVNMPPFYDHVGEPTWVDYDRDDDDMDDDDLLLNESRDLTEKELARLLQ